MNLTPRIVAPLLFCAAIFTLLPTGPARGQDPVVYSDRALLSRWSDAGTDTDTAGKEFHGLFGNQPVALTLERLPRHRWIKVTFDLYVIGSWDGSSPVWGPDLWSLSVRGGPRLINATLCAWGYAGNDEQSWPDDYDHAVHPAWTGVARRDVVSLIDSDPPKNGVYKVEVLFPHTADQVVLDFAGSFQDPPREQQLWGVGNVEVTALTEDTLTDPAALPGLWEDLASDDCVRANAALWRFVGAGRKAFDFIEERIDKIGENDGMTMSETDSVRMHRAHRIVRIIGGNGTGGLCFKMDQRSVEYARKYLGRTKDPVPAE